MVTLPTERSGTSKKWEDQKFLLIGPAGVGKSDFFQHAKNPLYIEAEPGLNFISACKVPCRSWEDVGEIFKAFKEAQAKWSWDIVVVDTIDRVVDYATQAVIEMGKAKWPQKDIQSLSDWPGMGGGWASREALVKKFLSALERLPCAVALIGHLETKQIEEDGQSAYHKSTISIGGKVGGDILAWADHTLHVDARLVGDTLRRTIYTKPTKSREAKSRGGVVKDGWTWSDDSKANFDKLREQFN